PFFPTRRSSDLSAINSASTSSFVWIFFSRNSIRRSSFPGTRSVVVRLGGPDGSWTGRQPPRSRRTLFANGRTPLAAAPVPHTDRKPALYPANAVLGCQPSLPQCSASALFACVLSVILTEERSLQFQLRQDTTPDMQTKEQDRLAHRRARSTPPCHAHCHPLQPLRPKLC